MNAETAPDSEPRLFLVELPTRDREATEDWYHKVLQARPALVDRERNYALMDLPRGDVRLALKQIDLEGEKSTSEAAGGFEARNPVRLTFECGNVDAEAARLRALGVEAPEPTDHEDEGYRRLKLSDPDGRVVVLFHWTTGVMRDRLERIAKWGVPPTTEGK